MPKNPSSSNKTKPAELPPLMFRYKHTPETRGSTYVRPVVTREPTPDALQEDKKKYIIAKQRTNNSNTIQNIIRKVIPLPTNAASVVMKKLTGHNAMDINSLSHEERGIMYKTVSNAVKRTGKLSGGTEYEDYENSLSPEEFEKVKDIKAGKINPILGTYLGATSPGYNMASTLGRVSYAVDPETRKIALTDTYDFKNSFTQDKKGNLKKDYMKDKTDFYSNFRKDLAIEDQNVDESKFHVGMVLEPSDTLSLKKRYFGVTKKKM